MTIADDDDVPWLHVYAQGQPHDNVHITGTRIALRELRDAIDRALAWGIESFGEAVTADRKGYRVIVDIRSHDWLSGAALPYYES